MIKVSFGEHDRCDDSMRPETRFVLRAISQKFSYSNFDNDMALLRLNDRVPITDYIRPICLPTNQGNYAIPPISHTSHCWASGAKWEYPIRVESSRACDWCHRVQMQKLSARLKAKPCETFFYYHSRWLNFSMCADHFPYYSMSKTSPGDNNNVRHSSSRFFLASSHLQPRRTWAKPVWWPAGARWRRMASRRAFCKRWRCRFYPTRIAQQRPITPRKWSPTICCARATPV